MPSQRWRAEAGPRSRVRVLILLFGLLATSAAATGSAGVWCETRIGALAIDEVSGTERMEGLVMLVASLAAFVLVGRDLLYDARRPGMLALCAGVMGAALAAFFARADVDATALKPLLENEAFRETFLASRVEDVFTLRMRLMLWVAVAGAANTAAVAAALLWTRSLQSGTPGTPMRAL